MFIDCKDINTRVITGEGSTEASNNEAQQIISVINIPHILASNLMGKIANQYNLRTAFRAVKRNKGVPGTDKRSIKDVEANLDIILENLGTTLVKGVAIPKADSNERLLGIPTVVGRIVKHVTII